MMDLKAETIMVYFTEINTQILITFLKIDIYNFFSVLFCIYLTSL